MVEVRNRNLDQAMSIIRDTCGRATDSSKVKKILPDMKPSIGRHEGLTATELAGELWNSRYSDHCLDRGLFNLQARSLKPCIDDKDISSQK